MGFYKQNSLQSKFDQASRISKSVFVSNFPEGCTPKDFWKVCNDYGTVVDVFILNKKSKAGKHFAFVRFIKAHDHVGSYVNVVNGSSTATVRGPYISSASALVLDDSCVVERDLSKYAMGKVKDVNYIPNLQTLLMDKGFFDVKLKYLGGMWVMFEFDKVDTKKWGETLDIEDNVDSSFGRKRLCIKTKKPVSILESFRIIFKAHSSFSEEVSGDDRESDVEEVSETIFSDNSSSPNNNSDEMGGETREVSSSLSHPPGFTSKEVYHEINRESVDPNVVKEGGSVLGVLEDMIWMNILSLNIQGLGHKTKKEWIKELSLKNNINFMAIQETKTNCISHMDVKFMWGNSNYNYVYSEAVENSGGILCVWEANVFKKDYATISDNFVAIYGTWLPSNSKILFVAIYAPQQASCKRVLWKYVSTLIGRWNGETIILGDFNEVRSIDKRRGSCFNPSSARVFDHFRSSSGLVDVKLEGYTFTWSHPSGSKMSKLDRFLVSEGIFFIFPFITALCLDCHLLNHRPILLREDLKAIIRCWVKDKRMHMSGEKNSIKNELSDIDKEVDRWVVSDTNLFRRLELQRKLHDINQMEAKNSFQKSKIKWAIEGKYWNIVGPDFCEAVEYFFEIGLFSKGFNSSFVALIPKVADAKFVNDFRPISLIGSVYKVVTKILANRLALVIADLVSDTQSAFVAN
uniref:RNA-directed DNA polymerase, eukaryota n=1 Tax=Tanacetum cinerariifolium TaxID=118510 RepID=A0A6L2P662_TANCI|nr:RNA-directed DNA polymerase, eukaryota [Tanacetum cinerariifolium]